mmetsp:Transcript_36960/g.56614  ORF Transcript_36960/g.56614 Transcript_36960/m.56614 type:complete len:82 (+) Transcript_36960:928-1173(+)
MCLQKDCFFKVISLAQFYLSKDSEGAQQAKEGGRELKSKKYDEFSSGNVEDALTKLVKLLANLSTEERYAHGQLVEKKEMV